MYIGVDVGGTNSDAVLMAGREVLGWYKAATTADIGAGVIEAIGGVIAQSGIDTALIERVAIGTTHFTNAFVQRRGLLEVAVVRLASPSGHSLRPTTGWPKALANAIGDHTYLLPGGYEFDGREISAFNAVRVREVAREIARKGLCAVAISSPFAQVNNRMEIEAAAIIRSENPDIDITLSSDIGRMGLLERENSAIMNASLAQLSRQVVEAFRSALRELNISAPFYITQNDGTLMTAATVEKFPVYTFASGPTNSIRGAAFLTGLEDAMVVDIGGTTCDIGVLKNGFARESSIAVDIGGVRTNFRMPDILALPLGGGTCIHNRDYELDSVTIGPDSVGHQLTEQGWIFGGDTLTATDIAVAVNPALALGDRSRLESLPEAFAASVSEQMHRICEEGIDRMKTASDATPVILVGGGSLLISRPLAGCSQLITPEYAQVANAIGAAIAQVGAEVDQVYAYQTLPREQALAAVKAAAIEALVKAGGCQENARIIDVEEVAINYLPGDVFRVRAKAVSELKEAV